MTYALHPMEKKVLKTLLDLKKSTPEKIIKHTGMDQGKVRKALGLLRDKGVITEKIEEHEIVSLGVNGLKYLRRGLPEKQFLEKIIKDKESLVIIRKDFESEEFNYCIGFLKRNAYIEIKGGELEATIKGRDYYNTKNDYERIIEMLSEHDYDFSMLPSEMQKTAAELAARKDIIKVTKLKIYEYEAGNEAKRLLEKADETIEQLTPQMIKAGKWGNFRSYDLNAPVQQAMSGKKHPLRSAMEFARKIWMDMGFSEMKGPMLDAAFWNFDALYTPQDHPARMMHDTFYMKNPKQTKELPQIWKKVKAAHENGGDTGSTGWGYKWDSEIVKANVLRTHTTMLSARTLYEIAKNKDYPAKYFSVGRCFRNETVDWKHLAEFYQVEGIVVGEEVNFRQLLGYLKTFFSKMGFPKARFRPGYFPYTEMSTQIDIYHAKRKKWIEFGGAGMFRPEVVKPIMGKEIPVLAWGPGFERYVMDYYKITDIREMYSQNIKNLREARAWLL